MDAFVLSRARVLQWGAAFLALCYHVRFLLFADYAHVPHNGVALRTFYFFSSLGHEAFLVYMGAGGLLFGVMAMPRGRGGGAVVDAIAVRLRSLYWLLVPALLLGGVLDALGSRAFAASGVYDMVPQFQQEHLGLRSLAGNLLLLQDVAVQGYGSNAMLFLLTYEWWACAACAAFALGRQSGPAQGVLAWMSVAGTMSVLAPEFSGYACAWLAGLGASRCGAWRHGRVAGWLGAACCVVAIVVSRLAGARLGAMSAELVPAGRVLLDMVASLGIGAYLLALHGGAAPPPRYAGLRQRLTRLTPALFSVHFPVVLFVVAAAGQLLGLPLRAQPGWPGALAFFGVVALVCLCAQGFATATAALRRALGRVPMWIAPHCGRVRSHRRMM